jgi:hypothetical protein
MCYYIVKERDNESFIKVELVLWELNSSALFSKYKYFEK